MYIAMLTCPTVNCWPSAMTFHIPFHHDQSGCITFNHSNANQIHSPSRGLAIYSQWNLELRIFPWLVTWAILYVNILRAIDTSAQLGKSMHALHPILSYGANLWAGSIWKISFREHISSAKVPPLAWSSHSLETAYAYFTSGKMGKRVQDCLCLCKWESAMWFLNG